MAGIGSAQSQPTRSQFLSPTLRLEAIPPNPNCAEGHKLSVSLLAQHREGERDAAKATGPGPRGLLVVYLV